jgi:hypothetical protein
LVKFKGQEVEDEKSRGKVALGSRPLKKRVS